MRLIPVEQITEEARKQCAQVARRQHQAHKNKIHTEMEMRILDHSCFKMMQYCSQGEHFKFEEISKLERNLQKSIIYLQKRKKKLIEKKNKKRV